MVRDVPQYAGILRQVFRKGRSVVSVITALQLLWQTEKLTLADRIYQCDCGLTINLDYNAAINIKNEGLRLLKTA